MVLRDLRALSARSYVGAGGRSFEQSFRSVQRSARFARVRARSLLGALNAQRGAPAFQAQVDESRPRRSPPRKRLPLPNTSRGPGGAAQAMQILLEDPARNPIELFEPVRG
jgi:hypothetical protein